MNAIRLEQITGSDADLKAALTDAHLPTDDTEDHGRTFFKALPSDGQIVGFYGVERWIGHPMATNRDAGNPGVVVSSDVDIQSTFTEAARFLTNRMALETKLRQIGTMEGFTSLQGKSA